MGNGQMKTIAIIQTRMGSTRLPRKAMMDIVGQPMLARVINRVLCAKTIDKVVIATTVEKCDDTIIALCNTYGWPWFRGDEEDVLERYYQAALSYHAGAVVRITGDCPLADPEIIDSVVTAFLDSKPDYASNTLIRSYPRGLDVSVMTMEALSSAHYNASEVYHRTHVTSYLYQNPDMFKLLPVVGDKDCSNYRWTVDTQDDLSFIREIYKRVGNNPFNWHDVLDILDKDPALAKINSHVRQKSLREA